jgi:HPt (histidine-containing phosphotransfer) domain-containing protein
MIATKQMPVEVLQELANEFAAGLPARAAVIGEAIEEIAQRRSLEAAQRVRLTAHSLAGTASAFGASELVPHVERLESLGKEWMERNGAATKASVVVARRALEMLSESIEGVTERLRTR